LKINNNLYFIYQKNPIFKRHYFIFTDADESWVNVSRLGGANMDGVKHAGKVSLKYQPSRREVAQLYFLFLTYLRILTRPNEEKETITDKVTGGGVLDD